MPFLFSICVEKNLCRKNLCGEKMTNMRSGRALEAKKSTFHVLIFKLECWCIITFQLCGSEIEVRAGAEDIVGHTLLPGDSTYELSSRNTSTRNTFESTTGNTFRVNPSDVLLRISTAQCVLCKVRWHCIFFAAVSDTIRRRGGYRAIITEEGVDTVTYFGGNHGYRVWKSLKLKEVHVPRTRTSWDRYMFNKIVFFKF